MVDSRKSICVTSTDYVFKYKKFLFNNQVDCNPNLRWCPVCSQKRSESEADLSINKYERDLQDLRFQVIQLDGCNIIDSHGNIKPSDDSLSHLKKKANSIFTRVNPYHGQC